MSEVTTTPALGAPSSAGTYLESTRDFPADLTELPLIELQVLHSRICRQLDREYLTDPHGPHPVTLERHHELCVELDARECLTSVSGTPGNA